VLAAHRPTVFPAPGLLATVPPSAVPATWLLRLLLANDWPEGGPKTIFRLIDLPAGVVYAPKVIFISQIDLYTLVANPVYFSEQYQQQADCPANQPR
jgi:hypothetical protein